jgi:hypothetical protein
VALAGRCIQGVKYTRKENIAERKWQSTNCVDALRVPGARDDLNNAQKVKVAGHAGALPEHMRQLPLAKNVQKEVFIVNVGALAAIFEQTLHEEIRINVTFVWRRDGLEKIVYFHE